MTRDVYIDDKYVGRLPINVYNLHMDAGRGITDARTRYKQVEQLTAYIQSRYKKDHTPYIVMGDTNLESWKGYWGIDQVIQKDWLTFHKLLKDNQLVDLCLKDKNYAQPLDPVTRERTKTNPDGTTEQVTHSLTDSTEECNAYDRILVLQGYIPDISGFYFDFNENNNSLIEYQHKMKCKEPYKNISECAEEKAFLPYSDHSPVTARLKVKYHVSLLAKLQANNFLCGHIVLQALRVLKQI